MKICSRKHVVSELFQHLDQPHWRVPNSNIAADADIRRDAPKLTDSRPSTEVIGNTRREPDFIARFRVHAGDRRAEAVQIVPRLYP